MKRERESQSVRRYPVGTWSFVIGPFVLVGALVLWTIWRTGHETQVASNSTKNPGEGSDAAVFSAYSGSQSCVECHATQFDSWKSSNHGLAERNVNMSMDQAAFLPTQTISHGKQKSEARVSNGRLELETMGKGGEVKGFSMDRVIGVNPLRQFLVPEAGGRYQITELAVDPRSSDWEWFDIFGDEDRQPGEWGHWTGRGMNWNNMCAACHNTRVRKNYRSASDSYETTMAEMSVGCEACHGPMAEHVSWRRKYGPEVAGDPTITPFDKDQVLATCGSCHARRSELTGDFIPGERFADHFMLTIPDETDVFYPDGQVRDEDYEYTSFLSSRMHVSGVRCMDCHDPHSSKTLLPGNLLCMRCHEQPVEPAPKIDVATHMHHPVEQPGGRCVDCHMPQTVYMGRHWRHDHGFTIPDPLLTRELGIPNACHRCHTEETEDWAIEAVEEWYGDRMERPTRDRARWIAEARAGKQDAHHNLLRILKGEEVPLWRAVAANLLKRWVSDATVMEALIESSGDTNAMVRAMSARALELLPREGYPAVNRVIEKLMMDSVRSVRAEAAWARRWDVSTTSDAGRDLMNFLEFNRDQPSGLLQLGQWHLDRGEIRAALENFQRSVIWDPGSAVLRHALAVALSMVGNASDAVKELEKACSLAPTDAELHFKLGLAYNEVGKLNQALESLKEAARLDPQYPQASYNLGLAYSALGQPEAALEALLKAESADSRSARIPYARATILFGLGRMEQAGAAASRTLEIDPNFTEAANLLRMVTQGRQLGR